MTATDPTEQVFWLASRALGIVALVGLSVSVTLGLALSGPVARRPALTARLRRLHEATTLVTLALIVAHAGVLLADGYLHPGLAGITLPFQLGYRPLWTGIGIIAGWLALILGLSFYARKWIGVKTWRWLHRWTLAVYVMALAHTLGSGTDAGAPWLLAIVTLTALPNVFLATLRFLPGTPKPRPTAASRAFHRVRVSAVTRLTKDSVLIDFDLPPELAGHFDFKAGQHVAVRAEIDGRQVRRTYSVCSPAGSGRLQIAVRRIDGGIFSTFAVERLRAGDELELMAPVGRFGPELDPRNANHYVAIAAGSGITPILSILATALEVEPASRFTLIYGNRTRASTMFADELGHLQGRHPHRLEVLHVRSREPQRDPLLRGRIDGSKLERLLASQLPIDAVADWFLCGPVEMVTDVRTTLSSAGVEPERVHTELFLAPPTVTGAAAIDTNGSALAHADRSTAELTIRLDGQEENVVSGEGQTVLEGALRVLPDAPYSCMGGTCGACRAKVVAGAVEMNHNFALDATEVEDGYVLTCQSHPASPAVTIDYNA